jgi:hypothetical protein
MTATLILHDGHETTYELQIKTLTVENQLVESTVRTEKGAQSEFNKRSSLVDLRGFVTKKVR